MDDLQACYAVLELDEGASSEAVDRAYRELSRVWHPDRFATDSASMQERARHKQQEVNALIPFSAYCVLLGAATLIFGS